MKTLLRFLLLSSAVCPLTSVHAQGSLTPPGPPGMTMKTLDQVEARTLISSLPYTINTQGSYYLTKNLVAGGSTAGIIISADNVALDLNGFALIGGGSGTVAGINIPGTQKNLCIRNGTMRGWTGGGVSAPSVSNSLLEKLRVSDISDVGITIGSDSMIKDCIVGNCIGNGIITGTGNTVTGCTVHGTGGDGLTISSNSTIIGCTVEGANSGITTGSGCTITDCTFSGNSIYGINAGQACTVTHCTVQGNVATGISLGNNSLVQGCNAFGNHGDGIALVSACTVLNSSACNNGIGGTHDGIHLLSCGSNNRVDGNNASNNTGIGIHQECGPDLIIRNTARGNASGTNYSPLASTSVGPVGTPDTSTSPWANFQ